MVERLKEACDSQLTMFGQKPENQPQAGNQFVFLIILTADQWELGRFI